MKKELHLYQDFVQGVTSKDSNELIAYIEHLKELFKQGLNMALLDTGATGLASESGEMLDIVKKLKFHGKNWDDETREKIIKELGDIIFYWANACRALGVDPYTVIDRNITKLSNRYPDGFSAWRSENKDESKE